MSNYENMKKQKRNMKVYFFDRCLKNGEVLTQ